MATSKSSGTTKKAAAKRPAAKKCATRKCAPEASVAPAAEASATAQVTAPNAHKLTEVARTVGSTLGAIAVTTKRALSRAAGKK